MTARARSLVAAAIAVTWSAILLSQNPSDLRSCVVIYDVTEARITRTDEQACRTRLSPASTFKIPHALVALETCVVTTHTMERWNRTPYPGRPGWERDHTVLTAMRPSVVWFFQRIAPRVGADRMRDWLARLGYGNADTSGTVTEYWLNGRLRISPDEQVEFLRRFYDGRLPFSRDHLRSVRDALMQKPGTVENSTGVHAVDGNWRRGIALNAKTGATRIENGGGVSWLAGELTADARRFVFAAAVWRENGETDPLDGARTAIRAFIARGLLEDSRPHR